MDYTKELEKLNDNQKEAVFDESHACLVNANVGSGKTTVLISKIMYLHYVKDIDYRDMVVLTFTNKAANEIKERLSVLEENLNIEELKCFGTFHSVALYLLRERLSMEQLGYKRDFLVIEPEEELDIALQLIQEEKLNIKYKNRLRKRLEQEKVSKCKDDLIKLRELLQKEKVKQNKMSFSDLLVMAVQLLKDAAFSPKWIIIDEVQDSDEMQLEFINTLMKKDTRIFAVGDPNQVIYSWRGSALNVFYTLKQRYQAKELSLPVNYRSNTSILEAARCFSEFGSPITGIREPGNKIVVKQQYDSFQEALYLADKIKEIHDKGVPYKEIAVFYRLQSQSAVLENVFSSNGIPFEVSLKKTIRDIPVLNWVMKVLRFSINETDISSGIYALSNKEYGEKITEKAATELLKKCAGKSDLNEGTDKGNLNKGKELNTRTDRAKKLDLFDRMLCFQEKFASAGIPEENEIYQYFSFDTYLHPTAASHIADKEAVQAFLHTIVTYVKEKKLRFLEGLADFINSSALYGVNILQKDINSEADSVKLMTLHASKGLEFSYVFIIGVNHGLIPLQGKSFDDQDEERRLFFVGITRAKDNLELSYYTNPDTYRTMAGESRFIRLIPPHLIQNDGTEHAKVNLQELKRLILAEKNANKIKIDNEAESITENHSVEQEIKNEGIPGGKIEISAPQHEVPVRQVSHAKYGVGEVIREDDIMITVKFEGYGEKEFIKAFSELGELR